MNETVISHGYVHDSPQGAKFSKYVLVIWLGVILLLIIATYCSYLCTRSRSRRSSTYRRYSITTIRSITTTEHNSTTREGINEHTLMQYPKFLYSEARLHHKGTTDRGCSICLADYIGSDLIRILPDCGHIFHLNCIDPWLRMHATCPVCRTPPGPTPLATPLAEVAPLAILNS